MTQIVWFKRDLRVADNCPLADAAVRGPVLPLYVFEPGYWARSDVSLRQQQFLIETLTELDRDLTRLGAPLIVQTGNIIDVLTLLIEHAESCGVRIKAVRSHEETGNLWSWQRDKCVASWLQERGIEWFESRQHGVVRKLASRQGWASRWHKLMAMPVTPEPECLRPVLPAAAAARKYKAVGPAVLPGELGEANVPETLPGKKWQLITESVSNSCSVNDNLPCPSRQPGGRSHAQALMHSFFQHRGQAYHRKMSGPATAEQACSRLSAHIALGSVSMREVVQCAWQYQSALKALPASQRDENTGTHTKAITAYIARLHWHCHFIQKLEDSPQHEVENVHRSFNGLRESEMRVDYYQAWAEGNTGYPFIDACMRSLRYSGWINFRMRAMLMSFASYQLWLHWRQTGLYLARLFTDYEPGIHWNQVQMQSGTTGINTMRVYNPVKQSMDQDAEGEFIKRWVPELRPVPVHHIHQPWLMSLPEQQSFRCIIGQDYPDPIVDHMQSARVARQRLHEVRASEHFAVEADRVQDQHGSRKSGISNRGSTGNNRKRKPLIDSRQQSFSFRE